MRVLVLPKNLDLGGTQKNAVDVSLELARMGHVIELATEYGPLGDRVRGSGIPLHLLPPATSRWRRLAAIHRSIRAAKPDVVHAYEVRGILEASIAGRFAGGVPLLGSILSTRVPWFIPERLPLTVGMPALAGFTRLWRPGRTSLIEPAITIAEPTTTDLPGLDRVDDTSNLVVLVSRLVEPFKREGILRTISALHELAPLGYRLLIVGDGPARSVYERAAAATNRALKADVVVFAGAMEDPTPAYAAAKVVVGNGMSVIRAAMASIPSVVVGREGYSEVVDLKSLPDLFEHGFYGVGEGPRGTDPLPGQIITARRKSEADDTTYVAAQVTQRYGISTVARKYEDALADAITVEPPRLESLLRSLGRIAHYRHHRQRLRRKAGRRGFEDENADNFVYGRLRNMALPPAHWGTGRNE